MSRHPTRERPVWLNRNLGKATGAGVTIAVIDSGYTPSSGIRDPRVLPGSGFVARGDGLRLSPNDDADDLIGHGTACVNVLLDMVPEARILPLRVFDQHLETSVEVIVAALDNAVTAGASILNLSLGSPSPNAKKPFLDACRRAVGAGRFVISAMPLSPDPIYPAAFEEVISVTAARVTNAYEFVPNQRGDAEFAANGFGLPGPEYESFPTFGSSFAAPHISAMVALFLSVYPQAQLWEVREVLMQLSRDPSALLAG